MKNVIHFYQRAKTCAGGLKIQKLFTCKNFITSKFFDEHFLIGSTEFSIGRSSLKSSEFSFNI